MKKVSLLINEVLKLAIIMVNACNNVQIILCVGVIINIFLFSIFFYLFIYFFVLSFEPGWFQIIIGVHSICFDNFYTFLLPALKVGRGTI